MLTILAAVLLAQAHVHPADAMAKEKHPLDANAPKPSGSMIALKVGSETSQAYVAKPKGTPRGGVLVIHEWWGLNDWIKHEADQLAGQGYLALAIDLYKGKVATKPDEAQALMKGKDEAWGGQVEEAGIEWLKAQNAGKVATIGWCMGGGESLKASLRDPKDVDATVMYYGFPVNDPEKLKTLRGPVLGIFANKDKAITPEVVNQFEKALADAGVKHEFHRYDADHAFANPSGGRYNGEAAKDAWEKTVKFLAANVRK